MNTNFASVSNADAPVPVEHRGRILTLKEGRLQTLIGVQPDGPRSPSRSLLVERFDLQPPSQTFLHVDQIVAFYLKSGTVYYEHEGRVSRFRYRRGQAAICMRNERESLLWEGAVSVLCLRVSDAALDEAARSLLERDRVELRPNKGVTNAAIMNLLFALEAEQSRNYPAGRLFVDSLETALAALLVTSYSTVTSSPAENKGGLPPHRLRRVLEFMRASIGGQVSLEDFATCAGLSTSHFSLQFRNSTKVSPCKYMLALRIERGKEMLRNSRLTVLEVAMATGFENQQHFATVFRRMVGVTPSNYRRLL
jgi:AraC family transcriptional regulator